MNEVAPNLKKPRRSAKEVDFGRLPPHDQESEQGVLGCIIEDAMTAMPVAIESLRGPFDFYDLRHQLIYSRLLSMFDARTAIDLISLNSELRKAGELDQVGGLAYLASLQDAVPSAANVPTYLSTVLDLARRRDLLASCQNTISEVFETDPTSKLIEDHEKSVLNLVTSDGSSRMRSMKENVTASLEHIETVHAKGGAIGVPTGLVDLDRATCGLMAGEMVVIAGRPSTGKTSLAMQFVEHAAVDLALPVGVFSLEMTATSLTTRMLCSRARVSQEDMRRGYLTTADFGKLCTAAPALSKAPIYIDDSTNLNIVSLRAKARRMHQLYGIKLLVVDYMQLLDGAGKGKEASREQEVARISKGCKNLAKELGIPVVVLCQLNRDMEKGKKSGKRKPKMADLRESGAIEQDADFVGLLWRPDPDNKEYVQLVIDKQRNGPTCDINLHFFPAYTRFECAAPAGAGEDGE